MLISNVGSVPVSHASNARIPADQQAGRQGTTERQETQRSPPAVQTTAANLQRFVFNRRLQFVVDHNSNQVIVKVLDKETDKVIKVLPPEELQRLHRNLRESVGFLFDESV